MVKLANNTYFQLGVFMSSAMVVQTIGWNQSTYAIEFDRSLSQQLSNAKKGLNSVQPQQKSEFLPPVADLLAFPFKSQSGSGQSDSLKPAGTVLLSQSVPTNSTSNNQELYLANTQSLAKAPSLIHQVKQGDTITKIASEYQVSKDELVELNQMQNSNVIFVNQRLQIPTSATQNNSSNSSNSPQPEIAKTNIAPSVEEDPYIANLRAEIKQMRAQYQHRQQANNAPKDNAKSASLVSVVNQQPQPTKSNPAQLSTKANTKAQLNLPSQSNFPANSIKQDAIALKLPPLSNPDAYLPNAFDGYVWPAEGVVTSGYGWRWGRMHQGVDIAAPIGTPVLAAASGTVVGAGWHSGFGNLIKLEHLDGSVTYYGHNNRILVTPGQQVEQGQQIAEMGSTGNSTGSHLHFEIHLKDRAIVDPISLLSKR